MHDLATGETFETIWDSLSFSKEEAANLQARSALMFRLEDIIQDNGWTQAQAAKHCGVSQPRVNDLLRGRIDRFSIDALVNMVSALGHKVRIEVEAA